MLISTKTGLRSCRFSTNRSPKDSSIWRCKVDAEIRRVSPPAKQFSIGTPVLEIGKQRTSIRMTSSGVTPVGCSVAIRFPNPTPDKYSYVSVTVVNYRVAQKVSHKLLSISLPNVDRLKKFSLAHFVENFVMKRLLNIASLTESLHYLVKYKICKIHQ